MMRRISSLALSSALCLITPLSRAEAAAPPSEPGAHADADKAQAAQRFDRGLQLFNEGDNAGALAEFKQTYSLLPNPIVLFNIGLVYAAMSRPVDAVDALASVVDSPSLSAEQRARAQQTLADQRQRIGRVSITTLPEGARIDVDGVEVARTPLAAPLRVAAGSHVIGAVAEGYAPARKEIIVAGNAEATLSFELVLGSAKRPANLTIHSRVPDAQVVLDGKAVGSTPLPSSLSVPAGLHSVELRRAGYRAGKQQVELGEGATGEVSFDLVVDAPALAREGSDFSLELTEPNANLSLDEEHLGLYVRPLRLPPGRHHLRLEVAGYLPFETDVALEAGKPYVLRPFLLPTPETRQAHDSNVRLHRTVGWVGIGAGAALLGVSVALVAVGSSNESSAQRDFDAADARVANGQLGLGGPPCNRKIGGFVAEQCVLPRDEAEARLDQAKTQKTMGFIGLGLGGAVLGTGLVFLLTGESSHRFDPPQSRAAQARAGSWAFTSGPGQWGLGLSGAF